MCPKFYNCEGLVYSNYFKRKKFKFSQYTTETQNYFTHKVLSKFLFYKNNCDYGKQLPVIVYNNIQCSPYVFSSAV